MDAPLQEALHRMSLSFEQAIDECVESTGRLAMAALKTLRRDELLLTQGLLRQQAGTCMQRFRRSLAEVDGASAARASPSAWGELTLMEESAVDQLVVADRIGMSLAHSCEWELRAVEAYTAALLDEAEAGPDRNPLRPTRVARALLAAVDAITDQASLRQTLSEELTRALAPSMALTYADIGERLAQRGLRSQDMRATASLQARAAARSAAEGAPAAKPTSTGGPAGGAPQAGGGSGGASGSRGGGGGLGSVDGQVLDLLRRLHVAQPGAGGSAHEAGSAESAEVGAGATPVNLIQRHRSELHQAASAPLDHMVIDVVAGLFDAILADPKVPPQMARLLARLQLPVLRAALGDTSFFSLRRHPVRRFVNRLASLASAHSDLSVDPGLAFLARVTPLVEEVASGDFDKLQVYEQQLQALEDFVAAQSQAQLKARGQDAERLVQAEAVARQQLHYQSQVEAALADLPLPEFLRRFLARDWAPVVVRAAVSGVAGEEARVRSLGRDLALSVLPKGGSPLRRDFLASLPQLVRGVQQALDTVQCPEPVRKALFGDLMPVHAESLKTPALSPLDHNLLVKRIEAAFGLAVPDAASAQRATAALDIDLEQVLGAGEAQSFGLVREAEVAWDGQIDISLDDPAETRPLQAADISIDGLPAPEAPLPNRGAQLIEHLELGNAYQMQADAQGWRTLRLSHISGARSFFLFTEGDAHPKTVTMTARMLLRLCEAQRFRALESASLVERATARARTQLAALLPVRREGATTAP